MRNLILIFCLLFMACRPSGTIKIENAGKDTVINYSTNATLPNALLLHVQGQVSDTFIMNNIYLPGGKVDTNIRLDWYDKTFHIDYKAYKATSGSLKIKYKL
jgi:hypothetical protein